MVTITNPSIRRGLTERQGSGHIEHPRLSKAAGARSSTPVVRQTTDARLGHPTQLATCSMPPVSIAGMQTRMLPNGVAF